MANEIRIKLDARSTFTISLASLANNSGRQSTIVSNSSNRVAAKILAKVRTGSVAPTSGSLIEFYLLTGDGTNRTDGAGSTDAAITVVNARLLGVIIVDNTTAKDYYLDMDTARFGPLGTEFGIAVVNKTGQNLDSTGGNHVIAYQTYVPEIQ